MRAGIVLVIIGAILAFALRAESSWIDMRVVGVILILGGAGFIARARAKGRDRERGALRDSRAERQPS